MATTLQNIVSGIRTGLTGTLDATKINAGYQQGQAPPYVGVIGYRQTITYDTGGPAIRNANYSVIVVGKNADEAEEIAASVDAAIDQQQITPDTIGSFQESYESNQTEANLYVWGVMIGYALTENIPQQ